MQQMKPVFWLPQTKSDARSTLLPRGVVARRVMDILFLVLVVVALDLVEVLLVFVHHLSKLVAPPTADYVMNL